MTLGRSIDELPHIVAATDRFFAEQRIDTAIRVAVDLAIEELFVNMVKHNVGAGHGIRLRMQFANDEVEVALTDFDVDPFDPSQVPAPDLDVPLHQRRPNGMGLYLVSKMVDSVNYEYRDRQSRVSFVKKVAGGHA